MANKDGANKSQPVALGGKTLQDKDMKNIVLGREVYNDQVVDVSRYAGKINGDDAAAAVAYNTKSFTDATRTATAVKSIKVDNSPLQVRNDTVITAPQTYLVKPADSAGLYHQTSTSNAFTLGTVEGNNVETANDTTDTRIFGSKAFDKDGVYTNKAPANSYRAVSSTSNATGAMTYANTANLQNIKLDNVQYGRVSTNIDALDPTTVGTQVAKGQQFVGTESRAFNAADAVNTYFYRGLNETTLAQMKALPQDAVYNYYGHALTYGLNGASGAAADPNSNSVGDSQTVTTLGDFVAAQYNVKDKKLAGNIYNVKFTNGTNGVQNPLVTFSGNVTGNTVVGTSTLTNAVSSTVTDRKGDLKASFYGDAAQELGGAVNALEGEKYGNSAWGAVFGAKRDIVVPPAPPAPPAPVDTSGNVSSNER